MSDSEQVGFGREVRLGLVLYGGVSLAIYMNGTTNELHRAVRGRGVYFLVKHLIDADIVVDVASGASAGGINGIFLSFALANDREFGTCAELWRRDGDLSTLLRAVEPNAPVPSVLDSQHYRDVLENGFRVMWEQGRTPDAVRPLECPSPTPEIDLFVTGTDFYGRVSNEADATGRVIGVKQHRTLFLLKHRDRENAKCQLDPRADAYGARSAAALASDALPEDSGGFLALAKLAQITSCFPGAFAPVHVTYPSRRSRDPRDHEADEKLTLWGALSAGEHYFVDGGVLDNKPFTTTLDAIFHRPADRRVCRHLLYLEPDPERFSNTAGAGGALLQPSFVTSVLDSVTRLPSYESIAGDLARIAEHNATIQRFNALVSGLTERESGSVRPKPAGGDEVAVLSRLLGIGQRVNEQLVAALSRGAPAMPRQRLAPGEKQAASGPVELGVLEELLAKLSQTVRRTPVEHTRQLLHKVDIDFSIRRLLALTYELEPRSEQSSRYRELWARVNDELQLLEIAQSALERAVVPRAFHARVAAGAESDANALWTEIQARVEFVLAYDGLAHVFPESVNFHERASAERAAARVELKKILAERLSLLDASDNPPEVHARSVLEVSEQRLKTLLSQAECDEVGPDFLAGFARADAVRYPLELASGVHQRDVIHVVRMSPYDAQRGLSRRNVESKLCGETFGHFGAFLKRSWRSNDILWGRLDGISRLLEVLLENTRFDRDAATPALRVGRLLSAVEQRGVPLRTFLGQLFPALELRLAKHAKPDPLDRLANTLLSARAGAGEPAAADAASELVDRLIEVAQLDALCEDLPKVIEDAALEQLEWRELKSGSAKQAQKGRARARNLGFSPEAWQFQSTDVFFNPSLLGLATAEFAEQALQKQDASELARYFRDKYAVGGEQALLSLPRTVLVDLGVRAFALAVGAIETSGGRVGEKVRENAAYGLLVRSPLRVLVGLSGFLRSSPHSTRAFVLGAFLYGALAVVANVLWFRSLYEGDGFSRSVALALFGVAPAVGLTLAWLLFRPGFWKRALRLLLAFALAGAVVYGLVWLGGQACGFCPGVK